ncbi:MAG: MerR family transcriptional regulator [Armatimonadetes bacterium]|nr:MerR family transcriptional regulator [Armatimonadota bacterium]
MNITLSVDEKLVQRARKVAGAMGKSLNQVVREYLEELASSDDLDSWESEFVGLSLGSGGDSKGWRFNRDELYERT